MLPKSIKLEHLDPGVRNLVVNLNRIPGVGTYTNCEGHVWRAVPMWPTKNGWVYFERPAGRHEGLVRDIRDFCDGKGFFELEGPGPGLKGADYIFHAVRGLFESHDYGDLFSRITVAEQQAYFARADVRRGELLFGWEYIVT